jgi:Ca-activated chloride channel homolog
MLASGFNLELTHPALLAGLLVLVPLAYYHWRSLVDFARWQQGLSLAARALIALLLTLSLAGLTLLEPTREQFVVFATDTSLSVSPESRYQADKFLDDAVAAIGPHKAAYLSFAAAPGPVHTDRGKAVPPKDDQGTDIAAAIEAAAGSIPPAFVPKIVLFSDGNQTTGDALKAALRAGIPISTVPLKTREDPEIQVSAVRVPAQVREGEPFNVEAVIDSNHDDECVVDLYRNEHKVATLRQKLKKGENKVPFAQSLTSERLATYTVRVSGPREALTGGAFRDTLLDNNSSFALVFTSGKPKVLIIDSEPKLAAELARALEAEGVVAEVRPPQGTPDNLSDLQNYELIVLSNVPATALTQRQMEVCRTYVQDLGGGLIMLGGDQSFGLGGYYKTVLEEILPVRSDFEKEKEKPSLAMVLVIDKSGSMGGQKIELAKDASRAAVELLGGNDKVGVLAFEGETYTVCDMMPCSNKGYIIDRIASIEAGGGTTMYPAMEEAFEMLKSTVAKLKHVIILTDGHSSPGDFEGISQSMAAERITVSTVGIGDCDARLLEEIARIGKGRYYFTDDPSSVPQIFAKETVTASKSAINERPFVPLQVRPSRALAGINFEGAPMLLGYVVTRPKPTCEFILATEKGDPLLCWWRYGLGMTAAFTSDAKQRWAGEWVGWEGFSKFWAQTARHVMRKGDARGMVVQVDHKGKRASVSLDAVDLAGRFLNKAETELTVIDPQLGTKKLPMTQAAPGRYTAEFETPHGGAYHLELAQKHQGKILYRQSRGLAVGYPDELRLRPTDEDLLKQLARVTGGVHDPRPETVFAADERSAARATPLWPFLIAAAALLFLLDVALRRIDFSLALGNWLRRAAF